MKIVYVVTRTDAVGGASIHVRDLAGEMLQSGHAVTVLGGGTGPVSDLFAAAKIPYRPVASLRRSINPLRDWAAYSELKEALAALNPDLVSAHTAKAGWIARAACESIGIPAVYTPHGIAVGDRISAASGAVFTLSERAAARWARAIICVSEAERELALEKRVCEPGKLLVVHNGVPDIGVEFRAEPGASPPRICSVARFEAPKDHITLLRAMALLRDVPWTLDLVGDGPLEDEARREAVRLAIGDRVNFLGFQSDVAGALARAQVFALSSRSEAFPRSILEAMRAGLPVVASDVGGVREAISRGGAGVLAPAGDAEAFASGLSGLLIDSAKRDVIGNAARASYEAEFRLETMVRNTEAVYVRVLNRS